MGSVILSLRLYRNTIPRFASPANCESRRMINRSIYVCAPRQIYQPSKVININCVSAERLTMELGAHSNTVENNRKM
ncbi:hypothetical protein M5D96_006721 [Drosophila gunungcola]|uniref:Uncharacterized protein n=1 Tax=Drosophila gunungcola TaxID=103775 RepID=A0A9P9YQ77_9MUSC|nr:hypothetical protein M5D96_006721 [Drosophila gunungcola]